MANFLQRLVYRFGEFLRLLGMGMILISIAMQVWMLFDLPATEWIRVYGKGLGLEGCVIAIVGLVLIHPWRWRRP